MFGETLRALRRERNITQTALAKELDVTQQTIGKWETGVATPPLDTVTRIAKFFGAPVSDFIEGVESYTFAPAVSATRRDNLRKEQIKIIGELILAFQYKLDGQTPDMHKETVLAHLETNPEVMQIVREVFQIVVDSLAMCAMEMSRMTIDRSIAAMTKQPFDTEQAIEGAKNRVLEKNNPKVDMLLDLLKALPEAMFDFPTTMESSAGGAPDGKHNQT